MKEGFTDDPAAARPYPLVEKKEKINGEGGYPQPADLDEDKDHDLPEKGQGASCVYHGQPGDALGRSRGEKGIDIRQGFSRGGNRKAEERAPDQYGKSIVKDERVPGGQLLEAVEELLLFHSFISGIQGYIINL